MIRWRNKNQQALHWFIFENGKETIIGYHTHWRFGTQKLEKNQELNCFQNHTTKTLFSQENIFSTSNNHNSITTQSAATREKNESLSWSCARTLINKPFSFLRPPTLPHLREHVMTRTDTLTNNHGLRWGFQTSTSSIWRLHRGRGEKWLFRHHPCRTVRSVFPSYHHSKIWHDYQYSFNMKTHSYSYR